VKPEFPSEIKKTAVSVPTPYGEIDNDWSLNNGILQMNLEVPFNTMARLVLTKKESESLKINGRSFADFPASTMEIFNDSHHLKLGSGKYQIEFLKDEVKP
jgi:alpha-L-rhamnosidase